MKFNSKEEKLAWLKATGGKIQKMQHDRRIAILQGEFGKAYSLLAGIQFARAEFRKVSNSLKRF